MGSHGVSGHAELSCDEVRIADLAVGEDDVVLSRGEAPGVWLFLPTLMSRDCSYQRGELSRRSVPIYPVCVPRDNRDIHPKGIGGAREKCPGVPVSLKSCFVSRFDCFVSRCHVRPLRVKT